jgi:hypothetical protein
LKRKVDEGSFFMRYILPISALFVCGALSGFGAVDPALLALIPPGAKLVAGVRLDEARSSGFGQYILNHINTSDEHFQEAIEQTGFDPRHDLDEVVFATSGPGSDNTQPKFVILARGTFDQNRIEAKVKAKGAVVQSYQGVHLIVDDQKNHHGPGFAFLDGGIAVMADPNTLRQIVAGRANATALDPPLQDQVLKASADNDAWFASSMPGSYLARHMEQETKQPMQHAQVLQSILQSSGGVHFGDVVQFSFDASARSPEDAVSLGDVLRLGGSMVQMQRQSDPRAAIVASAVDKMTITNSGPTLHATFSITEKKLEELVGAERKPGMAVSVDPGGILTKSTKP